MTLITHEHATNNILCTVHVVNLYASSNTMELVSFIDSGPPWIELSSLLQHQEYVQVCDMSSKHQLRGS